ncbi:Bin3-domain-containing protein [Agrocybe pediades]|nr:Bin3-domain-containing protein [Agrocybe pediades]
MSAPTYGNYHGYYTKRPVLNDERLASLPKGLFEKARVLDVGCNEGWVTCEIAQSYGAHFVVGVDIDESLISGAWRRRRTVWSMQEPTKRKATTENDRHYFPASCEHEFGSLPIPPSSVRGKNVFPHNITFRTADWVNKDIHEDAEGYDVVVGFSISKWIHLNEGEEGLERFFKKVHRVLRPGGSFVLEPQPWDSYAKARRMSQKLKENAKHLLIKPTDFESVLKEIGFSSAKHFGTIGEGGMSKDPFI